MQDMNLILFLLQGTRHLKIKLVLSLHRTKSRAFKNWLYD